MKCTVCGQEIPDQSKFCTGCGSNLQMPPPPIYGDRPPQIRPDKRKNIALMIVIFAAALILFIVGGVLIYQGTHSSLSDYEFEPGDTPGVYDADYGSINETFLLSVDTNTNILTILVDDTASTSALYTFDPDNNTISLLIYYEGYEVYYTVTYDTLELTYAEVNDIPISISDASLKTTITNVAGTAIDSIEELLSNKGADMTIKELVHLDQ